MHTCMCAHKHMHTRESTWHAPTHAHMHTHTYIHTCTDLARHFSVTWCMYNTLVNTHVHVYTVRHSMKDLRHAVNLAVHSRGRTLTLRVVVYFFDQEWNERVLVVMSLHSGILLHSPEGSSWYSEWRTYSISADLLCLSDYGLFKDFLEWRRESTAYFFCRNASDVQEL